MLYPAFVLFAVFTLVKSCDRCPSPCDTCPTFFEEVQHGFRFWDLDFIRDLLLNNWDAVSESFESGNFTVFVPTDRDFFTENQPELWPKEEQVAFLQYHILDTKTLWSASYDWDYFTEFHEMVHTSLGNASSTKVTMGQVLKVKKIHDIREGSHVQITSIDTGLGSVSDVWNSDFQVAGGGIYHFIDKPFVVPIRAYDTAMAAGLTAFAGALQASGMMDSLDQVGHDTTIFAPTNQAFEDIASVSASWSIFEISKMMMFHMAVGPTVLSTEYAEYFSDPNDLASLNGRELHMTIQEDGTVFINSARIIATDILFSGGVIHVIDTVLNPNVSMAKFHEGSEGNIEYSDAVYGDSPFTAGLVAPTSTFSISTGWTRASSVVYTTADTAYPTPYTEDWYASDYHQSTSTSSYYDYYQSSSTSSYYDSYPTYSSEDRSNSWSPHDGLSGETITAIVIGCMAAFAGVIGAVFICARQKKPSADGDAVPEISYIEKTGTRVEVEAPPPYTLHENDAVAVARST